VLIYKNNKKVMHTIIVTNPKHLENGEAVSWREWISDATDAACRIKELKNAGLQVERYTERSKKKASWYKRDAKLSFDDRFLRNLN
jgi:hypothetical protein